MGGGWLLESGFLMKWLLTVDMDERDEIGYVLSKNKAKRVILVSQECFCFQYAASSVLTTA